MTKWRPPDWDKTLGEAGADAILGALEKKGTYGKLTQLSGDVEKGWAIFIPDR